MWRPLNGLTRARVSTIPCAGIEYRVRIQRTKYPSMLILLANWISSRSTLLTYVLTVPATNHAVYLL